jgi:nitric oxide reductase subunit C
MPIIRIQTLIFFIIALLLSACNNELDKNIAYGKKLFQQDRIGFTQAPGCILCHSLQKGIIAAGPSLYGIAQRAKQIQVKDAEQYIRTSITDPAAYVVDGYRHDQMYPHYANDLDKEEIEALVNFLMQ